MKLIQSKIKELKKRILRSKEGETVLVNFGYLTLLQIAGYVFPFITMPYLARIIGANGFGKIAFAAAIITWIQTIADWGFNYSATRDVAKIKNNKDEVSKVFSNVLWARLFLVLVSFVVLCIAVCIIPSFHRNWDIIFVTFLLVPGHVLFPDWFFQALERMKYTTILNVVIKLLFTVAVFLFIHEPNDYIFQPLFTSIGYALCGIYSILLITKKWGYKILKPNFTNIIMTISNSTNVFINNIVHNLYFSLSVIILGVFCGSAANGILDAANKFIGIAIQLLSTLVRAFFPFLSRRIDKHSFFNKLYLYVSIVMSISLCALAPELIHLFFTPEFEESILVLQILAISIIFVGLYNSFGINYLLLVGKERELRNISLCCSCLGFAISFPLMYYFSYIGAAIMIATTRILLGISAYVYSKKIYYHQV